MITDVVVSSSSAVASVFEGSFESYFGAFDKGFQDGGGRSKRLLNGFGQHVLIAG